MREITRKGLVRAGERRIKGSMPIPVLATIHLPDIRTEFSPALYVIAYYVGRSDFAVAANHPQVPTSTRVTTGRTRSKPAAQKDLPAVFISAKAPGRAWLHSVIPSKVRGFGNQGCPSRPARMAR